MKAEYLIFNVIVVCGPLLAMLFYKNAKKIPLLPGMLSISFAALVFIIWDAFVVNHFWYFNKDFVLGIYLFGLPIEEILFFFTVPFACLFLWHNFQIKDKKISGGIALWILVILIGASFAFILSRLWYPAVVSAFFCVIVALDIILRTQLFDSKRFLTFLGIVVLFTLVFNGYLTARPVVTYNESIKTNINIFTIPIEDVFYGLALISLMVLIYEFSLRKRLFLD
jgi:lycopene cyclase domain-containing protein